MSAVLLFDLSDVLIEGLYGIARPLKARFRIPTDTVAPGVGGAPLIALTEGHLSERDYWQQVVERTHWPLSVQELAMLVRESFQRSLTDVVALLPSLRQHRLVLLSDQAREWMDYIDQTHPFLQQFERRFLSFEMGQTKRQVATFERVLKELDCPAHECFFIDDLCWNVERARGVGMPSHLFRTARELTGWLEERGLLLGHGTGNAEIIATPPDLAGLRRLG